MKLGILEKITIAVTIILVICGCFYAYKQFDRLYNPEKYLLLIPDAEEKTLPENIQKLSQKYKVYENLYNSDKPIFTYGYIRYTLNKKQGMKFHKALQDRLEKENLNYQTVIYRNWRDYDNKIEEDNEAVYAGDDSKCIMEDPSVQELDLVRDTSTECLQNACIIDLKKNKYIVMSKNIDFIIEQLKEYNAK